jgi:hypothetical protein
MQFQAKIVEGNKNPRARVVWAGGILVFVSMIMMCFEGSQRYGFWLFGLAIVVLIVGAILAKGDVDVIDVSATDLVVDISEIRIGETRFPLAQVSDLEFQVEGYDGMADPDGYARFTSARRRDRVNGMNNYLDFKMGEEKQEWQFYLSGPQQVQELGALLKELYSKGIPFKEEDGTGHRTFLFEPVSEQQWEDRMIENGYSF